MREKYEGQNLERLWNAVLVLAVIGMASLLGLVGWAIWRWL